ncbi:hypothetical protein BpHYR1_007258 [Brachionus plicatilis]|uniref:Uncharacterized protein n=1 Tax=Brachionus plicatilis TaxID=10195 RepID=A0A3M7T856_BRAPC|nr:hypothetical protein BpHYR1_007258 [Brachionus plicatilis]
MSTNIIYSSSSNRFFTHSECFLKCSFNIECRMCLEPFKNITILMIPSHLVTFKTIPELVLQQASKQDLRRWETQN